MTKIQKYAESTGFGPGYPQTNLVPRNPEFWDFFTPEI
jgi:hypothetical protein